MALAFVLDGSVYMVLFSVQSETCLVCRDNVEHNQHALP